ncbi:hypothetical protein BEP19_16305 [Ammoniphilus oxalaticus]|uniref:SprT-like domain-containing protein n=1 Tax=Ammoniphilus oxalaticus TaxID=66863 RepID=A0A419SQP6_9BACL|nr:SprT-like domain-containing protein [Ammoniphilus oxalaticus]RKD26761.1 hypothetical protein BEP19_16305 [Ammoniphilus oxalaticus]
MNIREEIDFSPEKLQALAEKLSAHFWEQPLAIPVRWNGRLTRSMGRFIYGIRGGKRESLRIEMSKYAARFIDREIFIAVLLHELCHYHLFRQGQPFDDHHPVFEQELKRVGGISTNTVQLPTKVYRLKCRVCRAELGYMQRFNPARYRSPCCHSEIEREETWAGSFKYEGSILKHSKVRISGDSMNLQ